jgi:hypothetical protein
MALQHAEMMRASPYLRQAFYRELAGRLRGLGLSRAWYYKAAALGEIRMIAVRKRGALRGVRLVVYDSVADYIRRSAQIATAPSKPTLAAPQLQVTFEEP